MAFLGATTLAVMAMLFSGVYVHEVVPVETTQSAPIPAHSRSDDFENARIPACRNGADWVHGAAVQTYFEDAFHDLDVHFLAFSGSASQRIRTASAVTDERQRRESFAFLHQQAVDLVPRLAQPSDLALLADELLRGKVAGPYGVHGRGHTQYLRVALLREMQAVPPVVARDPWPRIAAFLTWFSAVERMLAQLQDGGGNDDDAKATAAMLDALALGWRDGFRPIVRWTMVESRTPALGERLHPHVMALCGWKSDPWNGGEDRRHAGSAGLQDFQNSTQ